jgi:protease-4
MTKSTKWFLGIIGVLAILTLGFILLLMAFINVPSGRLETFVSGSGEKIAVVELKGVIASSDDFVRQVKKYREDRSIKGILLRIDSPGGAVVPSQEMYEEVKKTRDGGKPVVVSMGSLAASGGYYVACGASKLVANRGSLTGSVGVISEILQLHEALNKLGIDVKTIKSGRMKDAGSSTRKMTEQDELYFQQLMDDVHRQFIDVVRVERKMTKEQAKSLADGRVFTGEQAVANGLADTLGTYEDAIALAAELAGIKGQPSLVREVRRRSVWDGLLGGVGESVKDLKQEVLDRPILSYRFTSASTTY